MDVPPGPRESSRADIWTERSREGGAPVGRRVFLGLVALGAGSVLAGGPLSRTLSDVQQSLASHDATGLSGLVPGGGWRYYTVTDGYPAADRATYRLSVGGLVERPASLSLADLRALPRTAITRDFHCVTGWTVPDVPWEGVRLADLLESAGADTSAGGVLFRSFDGVYTESLSMSQAMRSDVLVADRMLGAPVSRIHGGPVRMYVAPMYGYKSTKWLSEIRVVKRVEQGYWERYGYDQDGWIGKSNGYGT
jgi:DMSO/TMAO reductase YedYZ molybdopterin-dependent catalytic subunit